VPQIEAECDISATLAPASVHGHKEKVPRSYCARRRCNRV